MLDFDGTEIEDAFLGALEPLRSSGLVRALSTYNGEMDAEDLGGSVLFPVIYVIWGGAEGEEIDHTVESESIVHLIVCDKSLRNKVEASRGGTTTPGVYRILKEARLLLHAKPVVPGWVNPVWLGESSVAYFPKKRVSVWGQRYSIKAKHDEEGDGIWA